MGGGRCGTIRGDALQLLCRTVFKRKVYGEEEGQVDRSNYVMMIIITILSSIRECMASSVGCTVYPDSEEAVESR